MFSAAKNNNVKVITGSIIIRGNSIIFFIQDAPVMECATLRDMGLPNTCFDLPAEQNRSAPIIVIRSLRNDK